MKKKTELTSTIDLIIKKYTETVTAPNVSRLRNLKLAQELARHSNIQVTQRYAHLSDDELDKGYYEIFEKKDGKP